MDKLSLIFSDVKTGKNRQRGGTEGRHTFLGANCFNDQYRMMTSY